MDTDRIGAFNRIVTFVTLNCFLTANMVWAQQIVIDGNTETALAIQGNVTDVTTATIRGPSAFNSFQQFDVYSGNVVNLHLPDGTSALLNLVHGATTNVDGVLNAIRDGRIGGKVYFANPNGFVVGADGVINVGALTVVTPTKEFMESFFASPGNPSDAAAASLMDGSAPMSGTGLIAIEGTVNAIGDVYLIGTNITNAGQVASGAVFAGSAVDFSDIVNINDLAVGTSIAVENGDIVIRATGDVVNTGALLTDGADGIAAGNIDLHAGDELTVAGDALIATRGHGVSGGGGITIFADRNATLAGNATIDSSAGELGGDAGAIEFSAGDTVTLAGGRFRAGAAAGTAGSVLIDPADINLTADQSTSGVDLTLTADNSITVAPGVTISTRHTAGGDQSTVASIGDSGDLSLAAPSISLQNGSGLYSQADNGWASGDITLSAQSTVNASPLDIFFSDTNATASIVLDGATLRGGNVTLDANASTTKITAEDQSPFEEVIDAVGVLELSGIAGVSRSQADASVQIGAGTLIAADTDITVSATARSESRLRTVGYPLGINYAESDAQASAAIDSGATIRAGGNLSVEAAADNSVESSVLGVADAELLVAMSDARTRSEAAIASGAVIEAGNVAVTAESRNSLETSAVPLELVGESRGFTVATSNLDSSATARVDTNLTTPGSVTVAASSITEKNATTSTAEPASPLAALADSLSSYLSQKTVEDENGDPQPLELTAGFSVATSSNIADASVGDDARIRAGQSVDIGAQTEDNFQLFAISGAEEASIADSTSYAEGNYRNEARAWIGERADVAANGSIDVHAETKVPDQFDLTSLAPQDAWDALQLLTDFESAIAEGIFSMYARSAADGETFGKAGTISMLTIDNTAEAAIRDGAQVNQDSAYGGSEQDVRVNAHNDVDAIGMAGIFDFGDIVPIPGGGTGGQGSIGGSYNRFDYRSTSRASIGEEAAVSAERDVSVSASADQRLLAITAAGGSADKFGVSGAVSRFHADNQTTAHIAATADVAAGRDLSVTADDRVKALTIAGGVVAAGNVGVGVSVIVNDIDSTTRAYIGRDPESTSTAPAGRVSAGNNIDVNATTRDEIAAYSLAGAGPDTGSGGDDAEGKQGKESPKGSFGLGLSADVSLNTIHSNTYAHVDGGVGVQAGLGLTVGAFDESTIQAISGGAAINTDQGSSGLGGAWSQNTLSGDTHAYVDGASVTRAGDDAYTVVDVSAEKRGEIMAISAGGAGAGKIGVAGSVSINELGGSIEARIKDTSLDRANLEVDANDTRDILAVGGALAFGGKAGAGAGVAINTSNAATRAWLDGVDVDAANAVDVDASSSNVIEAAGAAIAAGANGLAGGLSMNEIANTTEAHVAQTTIGSTLDQVSVSASDDSTIRSLAGAVGVGTSSIGFGASIGINEIGNRIAAWISGSSVQAGGDVLVDASADNSIETLSIGGTGAGGTAVAGAVSISTIDNDTSAEVRDGSMLATTQSIRVAAGSRETLAGIAGTVSGGGKLGIGGSVAVNTLTSTTRAGIDSSSTLTAEGAGAGVVLAGGQTVNGLAVAASSTSDIDTILGNASGGGSGGVAASVAVNVVNTTTEAELDGHATANGIASIGADNTTTIDTIGVAGAGAGSAAGGAVSDTSVVHNTTRARIGDGATVAATQAVEVDASALEELSSITVGAAGGGSVGIAGSASAAVVGNTTEARIGSATVSSDGDINVDAADDTRVFEVAGALALGGSGGISGSVTVIKLANQTRAEVGSGAVVDASGTSRVSANSFEDIDSYAVGGAGGGSLGVGASIGVKILDSETEAAIRGGAAVNQNPAYAAAGQRVEVEADNTVDVVGAAGGLQGGGALGAGASSDTTIVRNTTTASIGSVATVAAVDDVVVRADSTKRVDSFAMGGAGGGSAGVTGSVSVIAIGSDLSGRANDALAGSDDAGNQGSTGDYVDGQTSDSPVGDTLGEGEGSLAAKNTADSAAAEVTVAGDLAADATVARNDTQAYLAPGANVTAGRDLLIEANDYTQTLLAAGGVAGGGAVGVSGAVGVVLLGGAAEAFVGDSAVTNAGRATDVSASSEEDLLTVAASGAGAGSVALAGAAAAETIRTRTRAFIGEAASVNQDPTLSSELQTVSVDADSSTRVVSVSGSIGGGAVGGVGASVTVGIIEKLTQAWIGRSALVDAGSQIDVTANSSEEVTAVTASLQGGGAAGAAGVVSVHDVGNTTTAFIDEGAQARAAGNVRVAAEDDSELDIVAGGAGLSGAVGVGASVNVNTLTSETRAWLGSDSQVEALGEGAAMSVRTGELAGDGSRLVTDVNGLAVTALGTQDVFAETFGLAGSATVGVAGAVTVDIIKTITAASVGNGAAVNAGAAGLPAVRVAAGDHSTVWGGAQTLAGSGAASVSGSADTTIIEKQTSASIGAASMLAAGDIDVLAASSETVESLTADISGSAVAGFGGAVSVAQIDNETAGYVASGADIDGAGNLDIGATDAATIDVFAGNAALGGAAGVGGSVIVTEIGSDTEAWIGAASTDVAGATDVRAISSSNVDTLTVSGAGGGGAGVAAAVSVNTVEAVTRASIEPLAQVNQAGGAIGQRVDVVASDDVRISGKAGGLGLSAALGVGAATDVATVRNTVTASIGAGADVSAAEDIEVVASSSKDVDSYVIGASGGLASGIGGAVSIVTIGSKLSDDGQQSLRSENGDGDTASYVDGRISRDTTGGQLAMAGESDSGSLVAAETSDLEVSSELGESSADSLDRTRSFVDAGADVAAGRNLRVASSDVTRVDITTGGAGVGAVGVGGAVGIATLNGTTEAFLGETATADAGADVIITASGDADAEVTAYAGALGLVGLGAAVTTADVGSTVRAGLGVGSQIGSADNISITATNDFSARAVSGQANVSGIAGGLSSADARVSGLTEAYVGADTEIGSAVGNLAVNADSDAAATSSSDSVGAGLVAGLAGVSHATVDATTRSFVGDRVIVVVLGDVTLGADSRAAADADSNGLVFGLAAGGSNEAHASIDNEARSFTGTESLVTAGQDVRLSSNTDNTADADVTGGSGGLLGAGGVTAAVDVDTDSRVQLGALSQTNAADELVMTATSGTTATSGVSQTAVAAINTNQGKATTSVDSTTVAEALEGAKVDARAIKLAAQQTRFTSTAEAISNTVAAGTTSRAEARLDNTVQTLARIAGGADLTAVDRIDIISRQDNVHTDADAIAKTIGFTGNLTAIAENDTDLDADVQVESGAALTASDLYVEAETPHSDGVYARSADADGATVVNVVINVITVVSRAFSWIPFIGRLVRWITRRVTQVIRTVTNSNETTLLLGELANDNHIRFDGEIHQFGARSPELTINPDGSIVATGGISAHEDGGRIVLDDVINDSRPGQITFNAPSGLVDGSGIFYLNNIFDHVKIVNDSPLDLVINDIIVASDNEGEPNVQIVADTQQPFEVRGETGTGTVITIAANSTANIVFAGEVLNGSGVVDVTSAGGSIQAELGSLLEVNGLGLAARNGSIGSATDRVRVHLVSDPGLANPAIGALANGSIYLDTRLVGFSDEPVPEDFSLSGGNFGDFLAGADIDIVARQGGVFYQPPVIDENPDDDVIPPPNPVEDIPVDATYGLVGELVAGGRILIDAASSVIDIAGSLVSGFADLVIDLGVDGRDALAELDWTDEVTDDSVSLDEFAPQSGYIEIQGELTGNGSINVLDGYTHVTVSNASGRDLILSRIDVDAPGAGTVVVNGESVGTLAGITLGTFGHAAGLIDVTNSSASDVRVGSLVNQSGTTRIDNALGALEALDSNQLLRARDIQIAVGAGIGSSAAVIATDLRGGAIAATAEQDVYLSEVDGDMAIDTIVTSGDVRLRAAGSILDANANTLANVVGRDIELTAVQGAIGHAGNPLDVDTGDVDGRLTAAANDDLYVDEIAGDLRLETAHSAQGSVGLTARAGNLQLGRVMATAGNTALGASGAILDGDDAVDIEARSITLQAGSGAIGTPVDLLEVNSGDAVGDIVSALAGLGIHIQETAGDLAVGQIRSTGGNVLLLAERSLLNGLTDGSINVAGGDLGLTALSGSIGTTSQRLVTDATGTLTASAATGIHLEERTGDLVSDSLTSTAGVVDVLVANGNADLASVRAPDEVVILVQGSLLAMDDVESARLSLGVTGEGGGIDVAEARISDRVQARADRIDLASVTHTTGAASLHFDVAGNDGGLADSIAIRTGSNHSVVFDSFRSDTGLVDADTESLTFSDAVVGTSALFANRVLRVLVDYKDEKLNESSEPHDTRYIPFYMIFTGTKLATNANPDMFVKREQIDEEEAP